MGPLEIVFGPIEVDTSETVEKVKIKNLWRGAVPAFVLYLIALFVAVFKLPKNDKVTLQIVLAFALVFRVILVPFPPILDRV